MELNERIKILRTTLGMTQDAFGRRLGVSRSVISNLEHGVLVNENSILPIVKLAAKEFSVTEEWLFFGESPCPEFIPAANSFVAQTFAPCSITPQEQSVICGYLGLDAEARDAFIKHATAAGRELNRRAGGIVESVS